ncbi:MAG: carbonic anhydrase family protein [Myxococcota bacterium]
MGWSYESPAGPDRWGDLDASFAACKLGRAQSPVNIVDAQAATFAGRLHFHYREFQARLEHNGHTLTAQDDNGGFVEIDGECYQLKQFHFHVSAEHRIDGQPFAMEIHLVHESASGGTAVIGVLARQGAASTVLEPLWQKLPRKQGGVGPSVSFHPARLLPATRTFYHYTGSLTTPPCTEGVRWFVFADPITVSTAQLNAFTAIIPHNNRPVQPLHGRKTWRGGSTLPRR